MRHLLLIMLGLLFCFNLKSQERGNIQAQAKLFHRFENAIGRNRLEESIIDLSDAAREPGATIAVRICAKEPMPKAFFLSTIYPHVVYDYMTNFYNYSPERIRILRSDNCLGNNNTFAATELWVIPKDGVPPSSVESINLCQLQDESFQPNNKTKSIIEFRTALRRLIEMLYKYPHAVGIVSGYYFKHPSPTMEISLREARRALGQSRLASSRYIVNLKPWRDELPASVSEPKYPQVFAVEIKKDCK